MAPSPERQDEPAPDPASQPARPARPKRHLRLVVEVPWEVDEVCRRNDQNLSVLIHRMVDELLRKLTPERGPADKGPYAGEICFFERLLDAPTEVLALDERLFVAFNRFHEQLRALEGVMGSDAVRAELARATADVAEWVDVAQGIVRRERGDAAPQTDWEVTEP